MTASCPVCGDEFGTEKGVRDHAWDAHGVCHYCTESLPDREALYEHWLDAHGGDLAEEDRKRAESNVGDRTVCPVCDRRFADESRVRDHAWDDHAACHHCGDVLDDGDALHAHRLVVHGDELSRTDRKRAREAVGTPSFAQRLLHGGPVAAASGVDADRRTVLRLGAVGAVAATGVAGGRMLLAGGEDGGSEPEGSAGGESGPGGSTPGGSGGQASLDHPAAADIGVQPTLGPAPGDGTGTIVAFEDPSCPSCARFETNTFLTLKEQLIDGEDVSFVFRGIPVVNAWGREGTRVATEAMEAAWDRDRIAFWSLKSFYYANQQQLGQAVREETRIFLEEQTDLDVEAVMADVENDEYTDEVDVDLAAASNAGVRGTPTFYLFKGGSFVTDVVGPQSADVFASALGL